MTYSRLARHLTGPARARAATWTPVNANPAGTLWTPDPTAKTVETTKQPDPAWKKAVLEANSNRCSWVENGYQCGHTTANGGLEPKSFGSMKPEDCIVLCPKHAEATG